MREKKSHLYMKDEEKRLLLYSLIELKNELIRQGRYTDCIDELIFKITNAQKKKVKMICSV